FWRQLVCRLRDEFSIDIVEIVAAHGERRLMEAPSYFSTSIRRMASVINAMDAFVSADGGVMHLAAATETMTVGLFGVSDASKYGPYGMSNTAISIDYRNPGESIDRVSRVIAAGVCRERFADALEFERDSTPDRRTAI